MTVTETQREQKKNAILLTVVFILLLLGKSSKKEIYAYLELTQHNVPQQDSESCDQTLP